MPALFSIHFMRDKGSRQLCNLFTDHSAQDRCYQDKDAGNTLNLLHEHLLCECTACILLVTETAIKYLLMYDVLRLAHRISKGKPLNNAS